MQKISEASSTFRKLKAKYPDQKEFYSQYTEGGYLDKSYVKFYGEKKQFLEYDQDHQGSYA